MMMQPTHWIFGTVVALFVGAPCLLQAQTSQTLKASAMPPHQFKAAAEQGSFEWFFLLVDAGKEKGIWAKNGLDPQLSRPPVHRRSSRRSSISASRSDLSTPPEATLARSNGVPVKTVAAYFGETTARIFVAADGPIKTAKDLNGKKIGIIGNSYVLSDSFVHQSKTGNKRRAGFSWEFSKNVAALKAGQIDALYSAEGSALTLIDFGELRLVLPLAKIYPKPYTAVVIWAADDLIAQNPDLVGKFVMSTLEIVGYLKANPDYASELYIKRTKAAKNVADKAVASLNQILTAGGRGSGQDLAAAVSGNWQFIIEFGAVPANTVVKIEEVVDARFLPPQ